MRFRPFKKQDAKYVLDWIDEERVFREWSADRYKDYPAKPEDMIAMYEATENTDNFYPFTVFDKNGILGHMILRFTDESKSTIRFGFVIIDPAKRCRGYGKQMLELAIKYAFEFLGATKITLGVFENNLNAKHCYESVGFREIDAEQTEYYEIMNEKWKCIEMVFDK